jgi:hypothetical protein
MGLEPMTSPLPRECSTTELHQPCLKLNFFVFLAFSIIVPRTHRVNHHTKQKHSQDQHRDQPHPAWVEGEPRQRHQPHQYSGGDLRLHGRIHRAQLEKTLNIQPTDLYPIHSTYRSISDTFNLQIYIQYIQPTDLYPISGAQGRIRTSVARKERQIYSLLPLTTRPPVHILTISLQLSAIAPWPLAHTSAKTSPDPVANFLAGETARERDGTEPCF